MHLCADASFHIQFSTNEKIHNSVLDSFIPHLFILGWLVLVLFISIVLQSIYNVLSPNQCFIEIPIMGFICVFFVFLFLYIQKALDFVLFSFVSTYCLL